MSDPVDGTLLPPSADTGPGALPRGDAPRPLRPVASSSWAARPWVAVVAVLALAVGIAGWLDGRRAERDLRTEVAERLTAVEGTTQATGKAQTDLATALRDAEARVTLLETRIAESQAQQAALEALYRDLAPSRDEIALTEIEQVLLIASQQLLLAGNVPSALTALQIADAKLQRLDRPQFVPLRRAFSRDMDQLKAIPFVDVTGLGLKLDQAIAAVSTLPLAMDERLPPRTADEAPPADEPSWQRFLRDVWGDMKQLVRIESSDRPAAPLLLALAALFPAREPPPAAAVGAHRAREPRRRELQGRHRGGVDVGGAVFRHADEARADAAGNAETARRDAARRRDARSFAQPRGVARAAPVAGPRARAFRRSASGALTLPPCASCSGSCCSPPRR